MTNWLRLRWVGLAAVPSSLMLGVTSYLSVDISPCRCCGSSHWPSTAFVHLCVHALAGRLDGLPAQGDAVYPAGRPAAPGLAATRARQFPAGIGDLAVPGRFLHHGRSCVTANWPGQAATKYLTEFYLWMSVGGMVGGMFNALFAPCSSSAWPSSRWPWSSPACCAKHRHRGLDEGALKAMFPGCRGLADKGDEIARRRKAAGAAGDENPVLSRRIYLRAAGCSVTASTSSCRWWCCCCSSFSTPSSASDEFRFYVDTLGFRPGVRGYVGTWDVRGSGVRHPVAGDLPLLRPPAAFRLAWALCCCPRLAIRRRAPQRPLPGEELVAYLEDQVVNADRSYFGVLKVRESAYST